MTKLTTGLPRAEGYLASLANMINQAHEDAERDVRSALEHAMNAGLMLQEAKEKCGHGNWLPWLKANVRFSERTAQGYMQLAAGWDRLEPNPQRVADLPLREALALLADPEKKVDARVPADAKVVREVEVETTPRSMVTHEVATGKDGKERPATRPVCPVPAQDQRVPKPPPAYPYSKMMDDWANLISGQRFWIDADRGGLAAMLAQRDKWDWHRLREEIIPKLKGLHRTIGDYVRELENAAKEG